jgi:hypothetical protein
MKRPIEPSEIRTGDLIRREIGDSAQEWRVGATWKAPWRPHGTYYLLDRPTPPVELPKEPTLGWATWGSEGNILAVWDLYGPADTSAGELRAVDSCGCRAGGDPSKVTAFTQAVAVPKSALDELRRYFASIPLGVLLTQSEKALRTFLEDVNRADRAGDQR